MIAKILFLYTHNLDSASLSHIGGIDHLALPIFLRDDFGIEVESENVDGKQPSLLRQILMTIIPPRQALEILSSPITRDGFSYDTQKVMSLIIPHLPNIEEFV